ncbi:spermatogenesis-associated protein 31D3-like [Mustela lutreola]|uniref:spermatogenesis-associated protein 31D3-like n=1 Tax=Mustela lutreola TaxID=9666 RepID=UPI00279761D8|nr:spermatogenesis-associated protein 31D3-like [Mustela lutreola]
MGYVSGLWLKEEDLDLAKKNLHKTILLSPQKQQSIFPIASKCVFTPLLSFLLITVEVSQLPSTLNSTPSQLLQNFSLLQKADSLIEWWTSVEDSVSGLEYQVWTSQRKSSLEFFKESQGSAKRRKKGGTLEDGRWYQREVEETRKLISILRSSLCRHHDTIHFHQVLCPDLSCESCNSTTVEINQLLFQQALEDSTPLASTAPVTSSSFTLSPDFSAVPPRDLIPASLPEPSPPPASIFSPNPVSPVADFFPPSLLGDSLPPEPFPPLDSKFPMDHFPAQPPAFPPPVLPHHAHLVDQSVQTETVSLNTIFSLDPTFS